MCNVAITFDGKGENTRMLLHISPADAVDTKGILAVLDCTVLEACPDTARAYAQAKAQRRTRHDGPARRSVVLCDGPSGLLWVFSPLTPAALQRRLGA